MGKRTIWIAQGIVGALALILAFKGFVTEAVACAGMIVALAQVEKAA